MSCIVYISMERQRIAKGLASQVISLATFWLKYEYEKKKITKIEDITHQQPVRHIFNIGVLYLKALQVILGPPFVLITKVKFLPPTC